MNPFFNTRSQLFSLTLSALLLGACAHTSGSDREPSSTWRENVGWGHYISNTIQQIPYPVQAGCEARRIEPPQGVRATRKILLVHGFTACPQQFLEWAEQLSEKGVVVYLFLLPGHGFKGPEEHRYLPRGDSGITELKKLEDSLIEVARGDTLPTTVGGLSVGGAVATNALLRSPTSFDGGIFFTPYFGPGSFMVRLARATVNRVLNPVVGGKEIGWGPTCEDEVRKGRSGICTFKIDHLRTVNNYGVSVIRNARPLVNKIQFVGVESDPAANSDSIRKIAERMGYPSSANSHACFYKKGANHSLLSPFDSPAEDKFWKKALLEDATEFVLNGRGFRESGKSTEDDFARCEDNI